MDAKDRGSKDIQPSKIYENRIPPEYIEEMLDTFDRLTSLLYRTRKNEK